jgi:hypothetical protein
LIVAGATSEASKALAVKVLFGMVVRERRRIAALARTASSLDMKAQEAVRASELSEAALKSYIDEQRSEVAEMTRNQHDHILSLMQLVQDDRSDVSTLGMDTYSEGKMLVLARERIDVLEQQVGHLEREADVQNANKSKLDKLQLELQSKSEDCEDFQDEIDSLRSYLRQIRDVVENSSQGVNDSNHILDLVDDALHRSTTSVANAKARRSFSKGSLKSSRSANRSSLRESGRTSVVSPRLQKHVELMHTSDSAEDVEQERWVADIMADLSLIAEGKIPPSLRASASIFREEEEKIKRLTPSKSSAKNEEEERKGLSIEVASNNFHEPKEEDDEGENFVTPLGNQLHDIHVDQTTSWQKASRRSVFDRLVSPSHYTGTQKERFQKTQSKRERLADHIASRVLDDILESDFDQKGKAGIDGDRGRRSKSSYTEQDVFERLQRTATQSYALKHNTPDASEVPGREGAVGRKSSDNISERSADLVDNQVLSHSKKYTSQNVFERLQRTTTEAFAQKTNKPANVG